MGSCLRPAHSLTRPHHQLPQEVVLVIHRIKKAREAGIPWTDRLGRKYLLPGLYH